MSQEGAESSSWDAAAATATAVTVTATTAAHRALTDRSHLHSRERSRYELTSRIRSYQERGLPKAHQLGLNFPKLDSDGSTHSLTSHSSRVYEQTPPAALSSLGIRTRMMQREMDVSYSTSSLSDSQYDMIDDLSEISDDHETASLASNDRDTTHDGDSEIHETDQDEGVILTSSINDHDATDDYITLPSQDIIESQQAIENGRQHEIRRENDLLDSYMSEDLETPRQSTLAYNLALRKSPAKENLSSRNTDGHAKSWLEHLQGIALFPTFAAILLVCLPYGLLLALRFTAEHPNLTLAVRRESLIASLNDGLDIPSLGRSLDVEHLLPHVGAECLSTDIFGRHWVDPSCKQSVRYQGLSPNLMLVAFPGYGHFPVVVAAEIVRSDGRKIDFNRTELIEGVHAIALDPEEAFGSITVGITTKKPAMEIQASHNYGSRMLQRKTYEKAGADVSNAVSKEVAVMRDAAKTLTGKMSTEFKIGYRDTKMVTTELAMAMFRAFQWYSNVTGAVFDKAAKAINSTATASNKTATAVTKDLVLLQQDLVKFSKDLSTSVTSTIKQAKKDTKTAFRNPLARSREHLLDLGHAFSSITAQHRFGSKKERSAQPQPKVNERSSRKPTSDSHTLASSVSYDEPAQPSRQCQRQVNRVVQQMDRVQRHIERKEQEFRDTGHRELRKEIRQLKKEYKQRAKALKKLVKDLRHR